MKRLVLLLVLVLVTACVQSQLQPENDSQNPVVVLDDNGLRPDIPRTVDPKDYDYPPGDEDSIIPPKTNGSVFLEAETGGTKLRIPLFSALGENYPVLGYEDVPFLRPAPIRTGDERIRGYRQFLRFDFAENSTGNITFVVDDSRNPEYIGTALFFSEDKPIFEYSLLLNDRAFFDPTIVGSQIVILGNTYQIMEATNFTALFNGIDVPQYIRFTNGSDLETNKQRVSDSEVEYDGFGLTYRLFAQDIDEDGLWLREGESLSERLGNAMPALLGFDIRYDGLEALAPEAFIDFGLRADENKIKLSWTDALGEQDLSLLALTEDGELMHGDGEHELHLRECNTNSDPCVQLGDSFVLFGRLPGAGGVPGALASRVLRFSDFDTDERILIFRDQEGNRISVDWSADRYQEAVLPFLDREYRIWVINETYVIANSTLQNSTEGTRVAGIAIDLDGDNGVRGEEQALYFDGGIRVSFENVLSSRLNSSAEYALDLVFETGPHNRDQDRRADALLNKEFLRVQAVWDGARFVVRTPLINVSEGKQVWSQELFADPEEEYSLGVSPWGSTFFGDHYEDFGDPQLTDELLLTMPLVQRFGQVSLIKQE